MSTPAARFIQTSHYTDPEAYAVAQGLTSVRILATPPKGFTARASQAMLGRVYVATGEASAAVTMVGHVGDAQAFTFATRPAPPRTLSGREVSFRTLFRHRPREVMTGHSPSGIAWPYTTVALMPDVFDRHINAVTGRPVRTPRDDAALYRIPATAHQRLLAITRDAIRVGGERPELLGYDAALHALSGAVMDALAACLTEGEPVADRAALRRQHLLITRLEELLHSRAHEMLSLSDLCAALGTAERTLQLACQSFLGIGAMRHARNRRLELVHSALKAADPHHTKVADIAMRYGFWELGRFAGAYTQRFGERPLATLRRHH